MSQQPSFSLAPGLQIPSSFVSQKCACLGTSGSGKTYGAGVLVEGLIGLGRQVVVIDTVGNWWGLRFATDGVRPGLRIPVIGGDHGDHPLAPEHGREIAETIAGTTDSMVIDVSDFEDGELRRFVIAFAKALLRAKKKMPSPVMVVWEECQDIIPQTMYGDDAKMVGAVQKLIKRGRNYGVGTTLISQRSAAVNKGCLNQIETLFAFRTSAPLDRKTISDWVDHVGAEAASAGRGQNRPQRLTDRVHELDTGSCVVYSPHVLKRMEIVHVNPKKTFDASKTPDDDDEIVVRTLPPIDMAKLKKRLDEVVRDAKENDVAALKARIKELEAKRPLDVSADDVNTEIAALEKECRQLRDNEKALRYSLAQSNRSLISTRHALTKIIEIASEEQSVADAVQRRSDIVLSTTPPVAPTHDQVVEHKRTARTKDALPAMRHEGDLTERQRIVLTALAQHPDGLTPHRIQTQTGYAASGKMSDTYTLFVREGWATRENGSLKITKSGIKKLGAFTPLPTGNALFKHLQQSDKLSPREKKILEIAQRFWPNAVAKGTVVEHSGWAASGKMSDCFTSLTTMGYLTKAGAGKVRLGEALTGH